MARRQSGLEQIREHKIALFNTDGLNRQGRKYWRRKGSSRSFASAPEALHELHQPITE